MLYGGRSAVEGDKMGVGLVAQSSAAARRELGYFGGVVTTAIVGVRGIVAQKKRTL